MGTLSLSGPRFVRVAAAIGDATRARMLGALADGARLPAGEIAQAAGVSASTASAHLAKLVEAGLVAVQAQGRHRYYGLSDTEVAHALETLAIVGERSSASDKWQREPYRSMKFARSCYRHLAGELGVRLHAALTTDGRLVPSAEGYVPSAKGSCWLEDIGLRHAGTAGGARYAYPCIDWSERRYHLAGKLATSLLDHFLEKRWLMRVPECRALRLTPQGKRALEI